MEIQNFRNDFETLSRIIASNDFKSLENYVEKKRSFLYCYGENCDKGPNIYEIYIGQVWPKSASIDEWNIPTTTPSLTELTDYILD